MDFYDKLAQLLTYDPGERGLAGRAPVPDLRALARTLMEAERVFVLTGFPIPACGVGETDGPPGAAAIAGALAALDKPVWMVTDPYNLPLVQAAVACYVPGAAVISVPTEGGDAFCDVLLRQHNPTHVIALERPGRAADGHYHNMHGHITDACVGSTDGLFAPGVVTVGIGDGGNELGMGAIAKLVGEVVPNGPEIAARLGCDYPLVAGVSNWWGWGIAAILSVASGRNLLPTDGQEEALLRAVVEAGGVDGMLKAAVMSVDGIPLADHIALLQKIRALVDAELDS